MFLAAAMALTGFVSMVPTPAAAGGDDPVWTFMVYMAADNDLEDAGIDDFNEMEMTGSTANMNLLVQFDRAEGYDDSNGNWTGTRRYSVDKDADENNITSTLEWDLGEVNMGDPASLTAFIEWGIDNYSADRYVLVLWDHGSGREICRDDEADDELTLLELGDALAYAYLNTSQVIDIVVFDACLMGTVEVCYEIAPYADYAVASEMTVPGDGMPYDDLTGHLKDNLDDLPGDHAVEMAWMYYDHYMDVDYYSHTMAAINLSYMQDVADAVSDLADVLIGNMSGYENLTDAWFETQFFDTGGVRMLLDLYNFTENLRSEIPDTALRGAAEGVMDAVDDAVMVSYNYSAADMFNADGANGLSVYAPMGQYMWFEDYIDTGFDNDTGWSDMLWDYYVNDTDEWYYEVSYETWDYDGDLWDDSVNITFDIDTGGTEANITVGMWVFNSTGEDVHSTLLRETVHGEDVDDFMLQYRAGARDEYHIVMAIFDGHDPAKPLVVEDFYEITGLELNNSGYCYNGTLEIYVNSTYDSQWGYLYVDGDWWGDYWIKGHAVSHLDTLDLGEGRHDIYFYLEGGPEDETDVRIYDNETTNITLFPALHNKDKGWLELWVYNRFNETVLADLHVDGGWWGDAEINATEWHYFGNFSIDEGWHWLEVEFNNSAYNYTGFDIYEYETTRLDVYPDITYGWAELWVHNGLEDQWIDLYVDGGWHDDAYVNSTDDHYFGNVTLTSGNHFFEIRGEYNDSDSTWERICENETTQIWLSLEEPKKVHLKGYVRNGTGHGIPNASVEVEVNGDRYRNTTDQWGYYESWVAGGDACLRIRAEGYRDHEEWFRIDEDRDEQWYNATLRALSPRYILLRGFVADPWGGPLDRTYIDADNWDENFSGGNSTNETGYYELWVPAGQLHIHAWCQGYVPHDGDLSMKNGTAEVWYNITLHPLSVKVHGHVYDNETNESLANFDFGFHHDDLDAWNGSGVNDTGYYEFRTAAGNVTIHIWYLGYRQWIHSFHAGENETVLLDIYLDPLPDQTALIHGRISDGYGDPAPWADIHIYNHDWDYHNWTQGDQDGYYEIWVVPGNISFDVDKEGFEHFHDFFFVDDGRRLEYNVTLRKESEKNAVVYGWVNDTRGNPLENVGVGIYHHDRDYYDETYTDENGFYRIGTYDGWSHISTYHESYFRYEADFDVYEGDNLWNITLEKVPPMNSTVCGWVFDDETGDPLAGATVFIYDQGRDEGANWTETNESGYYEVDVYAGDEFVGAAWASGFFQGFVMIAIAENETLLHNFSLERQPPMNSTIYGRITDAESGDPLGNVQVRIEDRKHHNETDTWTDENGYYGFRVYEGRWNIRVDGGWEYFSVEDEFTVGEGEHYNYSAALEKRPPYDSLVRGYVLDNETGEPIEGMRIVFHDPQHYQWEDARTDENGYYERWLYSAGWEVEIKDDDGGEGQDRRKRYMDFEDELYVQENAELWYNVTLVPLPDQTSMLRGFVTNETGAPLQAFVMANSIYYDYDNDTSSDGSGYYEIHVYEGLNLVLAMMQQGYYANLSVMMIEENETVWFNITLHAIKDVEHNVSGYVLDEKGAPVEGARVMAVAPWNVAPLFGDDGDGGGMPGTEGFFDFTDHEGRYELQLPAGSYYIGAIRTEKVDGGLKHGALRRVDVGGGRSGDMTDLNFTLEPDEELEPDGYILVEYFDNRSRASYIRETSAAQMMEAPPEFARLMIDYLFGDRNGYVNESEAMMFEEFFRGMAEREGDLMSGPENDTGDFLWTDGAYYEYNVNDSTPLELRDVEGNITGETVPVMYMEYVYDAFYEITDENNHTLELRVDYDIEHGNGFSIDLRFREGTLMFWFKLKEWQASELVHVGEYGDHAAFVQYIGKTDYGGGKGEWVTLNITSLNLPPLAMAWIDSENHSAYECEEIRFYGDYYDPESENLTFEWDFGDGNHAYTRNATHAYRDDGNYTVTFTVFDDEGAWGESFFDVYVMVSPVPPQPDITEPVNGTVFDEFNDVITVAAKDNDCNDTVMAEFVYSSTPGMDNHTRIGNDTDGSDGWSVPWNVSGVADGMYYLVTRFTDDDGNEGYDVISVIIDRTAPGIELVSPGEAEFVNGEIAMEARQLNDTDAVWVLFEYHNGTGRVEIYNDTDGSDGWSASWNTTLLPDGAVNITATAGDAAGHTGSHRITVRVDNTGPGIAVTGPWENETYSGNVTFSGSADDGQGAGVDRVRIFEGDDGEHWGLVDVIYGGTWDFEWDSLSVNLSGEHNSGESPLYLLIVANDTLGNANDITVRFYVDNVPPGDVELTGVSGGDYLSGMVRLGAEVEDENDTSRMGFYYRTAGGALDDDWVLIGNDTDGSNGWSFRWDTASLDDGAYEVMAAAEDAQGNTNFSGPVGVNLDNTPPEPEILTPPEGKVSGTVEITGWDTREDPWVSALVEYMDGMMARIEIGTVFYDGNNSFSISWDTVPLQDSYYPVNVVMTDRAGNTGEAVVEVYVDNTPPEPVFLYPTEGQQVGDQELAVEVEQVSGNDAAYVNFYYMAESDDNVTGSAALADGAGDPGSRSGRGPGRSGEWTLFAWDIDGSNGWSVLWNISGLDEGNYSIMADMTDDVGNSNSATTMFSVDRTRPWAGFEGVENGQQLHGTFVFGITSDDEDIARLVLDYRETDGALDEGGALEEKWEFIGEDADGSDGWSVEWDTTAVDDGNYEVRATVEDHAGNAWQITVEVSLDNSAPAVSIIDPAGGEFVGSMVPIAAEQLDGGDAVMAAFYYAAGAAPGDWHLIGTDDDGTDDWSIVWNAAGIPDGAYSLKVVLYDVIGNPGEDFVDVVKDPTAPAPVTALMIAAAKDGTAGLHWTLSVSPDVHHYNIYAAVEDFTSVAGMVPAGSVGPGVTLYTVAGLENGTRYYFAVAPVDEAGNQNVTVETVDAVVKKTVVPAPELVVVSITAEGDSYKEGKTVTVSVVIENVGDAPAEQVKINIYVDDELKAVIDVGTAAPGARVTEKFDWKALAGNHIIKAEIVYKDAGGTPSKSVELTVKEKSGDDDSPSATFVVAAAALVGTALAMRRRRRRVDRR